MCVFWRSGWGVTQAENLAWTNENYAYGINLYNRHGGLYTLMGGGTNGCLRRSTFTSPTGNTGNPLPITSNG